eukprot:CAMPEP_0178997662 /NCGR_PEP_ID=MMETSP0795-20121207/9081_1 /TAXON_ID=88552 /ORGANISM="Amoebophrya sp., Strain Ameob2" /LENGTH=613 /DNA_ID=CAMNT_0020690253 /DNA_START=450 /DNA_END=2291 /DNA_ORIENTATION=+
MAASCAPTSLRARPSSSAASSTLQNRFSWVLVQKPASTPSLVREFRELAARTLNVNAAETAVLVRGVDGSMQDVTNDVQFDETTARTIFEGVEGEGLQNEEGTLDLVQVRVDPKRQQYYQALQSILEVYGASAVDEDEIADEKDAAREEGTLTPAEWVRNLVEKADKDVKRDTAIMSIASEIAPGMEADLLEEDIRKKLWAEWTAEYDAGDGDEGGDAEEDGDEMSEEDDAHRQLEALEEAREGDEVDMRMCDEGAPADVGDGCYGYLQKYGLFEQVAEHGHGVVLNLREDPDSDSGQISSGTKVAKFLKAVEESGATEDVFHRSHFRMFAPALRANKDIVESGVRTNVHNFGKASDELRLDADFICDRLLPAAGAQVYQNVLPELAHSPAFATRFLLRADAMYGSLEKEVAAAAAAEDGEETPDAPAGLLHKAERFKMRFEFGAALCLGDGAGLLINVLDRNNKEHRKLVHFAMERGLEKKRLGLRWQYVERAKEGAKAGTSSSDKSEDDEDIDWVGEVDEDVLHDLQKMAAVDKLHRIYRTQGLVLLPSTTADDVQEQFGVWKELSQARWKFDALLKILEGRGLRGERPEELEDDASKSCGSRLSGGCSAP